MTASLQPESQPTAPLHPDEVFADFVRSFQPTALRICRRYRIPPQDAEDLMQQAFMALIDARHTVENPRPWLAGTLRNHCLMYWRRQRRRLYRAVDSAILEDLATPMASEQQAIERNHDLARVLGRLPSRCRSILQLRYGLGCRPQETAERLGYRASSIYKILDRCLAALSRSLTVQGLAPGRNETPRGATECQFTGSD